MVLLRKVIGDALRARRQAQHRTLREVSTAANVSLGYLSEIERGHKEASSELLASICDALGAPLSQMLGDVSATFALAEQMEDAFSADRAAALALDSQLASPHLATGRLALDHAALDRAALDHAVLDHAVLEHAVLEHAVLDHAALDHAVLEHAGGEPAVTDGEVTVQVHSDGPLKTMLTTKRIPPGQRHTESVFAA